MTTRTRIFLVVALAAASVWLADAVLEYLFQPNVAFLRHFFVGVTPGDMAHRLVSVAILIVMGWLLSKQVVRRREASARRRQTEVELQTLLDALPEMVIRFDTGKEVIWANRVTLDVYPDALGKPCSEAFDCTCDESRRCAARRALATGKTAREMIAAENIRGVEGLSYWEDIVVPLVDESGEVTGLIGVGRDVTVRELNRQRLQLQAQMLASVREAVVATDEEDRVIYWSRGCETLFGYTAEEMLGQSIHRLMGPHSDLERAEAIRGEIREKTSWHGRIRLLTKDGSEIYTESLLSTLLDEDGQFRGFVGVHRDATDEVNAMAALAESEQRYRTIFYSSHAMGLLLDPDTGEILDANEKAVEFYGWDRDELIGRRITSINTLSEEEVRREMQRARAEERTHFTFRHRLAGGDIRDVEIYSGPIVLHGRTILYSIIYDVTERRRNEERLEEYQRSLRRLASELAMAEDRQRRRLASALHDGVSQRLFAIKTRLSQLRRNGDNGGRDELIVDTLELVDRTMRDSRSLTLEICPPTLHEFGLVPALGSLAENFQGQYNMSCRVHSEGSTENLPPDVRGLLYQSARELLTNAAKHANATAVTISVLSRGPEVHVVVQDDGEGFAVTDETLKQSRPSGFGLFSIRERLNAVGGRLDVESVAGEGTRIEMAVPLGEQTGPESG
jgi:PAS domain S-box-containing protein